MILFFLINNCFIFVELGLYLISFSIAFEFNSKVCEPILLIYFKVNIYIWYISISTKSSLVVLIYINKVKFFHWQIYLYYYDKILLGVLLFQRKFQKFPLKHVYLFLFNLFLKFFIGFELVFPMINCFIL